MSRTLDEAVSTVRYHLRDRNPQDEAFSEFEYVRELQSATRLMAGELLLGEAWIDGFITLIAGTSVYGVPAGTLVDRLLRLRLASDGTEVPIVSQETFAAYREGDTGSSTGQPQVATLREGSTQGLEVMFWPTPSQGDSVSALRSALPAAFYTAGTGKLAALPASTTIPFDDAAFEALCYRVAIDMFNRLTDEWKAKLMLGPNTAAQWENSVALLVKASRHRRRRQQSGTHVRSARRW